MIVAYDVMSGIIDFNMGFKRTIGIHPAKFLRTHHPRYCRIYRPLQNVGEGFHEFTPTRYWKVNSMCFVFLVDA